MTKENAFEMAVSGVRFGVGMTRRTAPPAPGSLSGTSKFLTAKPRRTSRVDTISHSAFIFISSSVVSVSVFSAVLRSISAFAPLKS